MKVTNAFTAPLCWNKIWFLCQQGFVKKVSKITHDCIWQNAYYSCRFSVAWVLQCPAGVDHRYQVISGFCCHLGLTDTLSLFLKLLYCEFQKYEFMTMSEKGGQPKEHAIQLQSNKTCQAHLSELWLFLVIKWLLVQWGSVLELESFCQPEATLKADNNDFQYQIDVCQNTSAAPLIC